MSVLPNQYIGHGCFFSVVVLKQCVSAGGWTVGNFPSFLEGHFKDKYVERCGRTVWFNNCYDLLIGNYREWALCGINLDHDLIVRKIMSRETPPGEFIVTCCSLCSVKESNQHSILIQSIYTSTSVQDVDEYLWHLCTPSMGGGRRLSLSPELPCVPPW